MKYLLHRQQTLIGRILNWWATNNCKHAVYYDTDMQPRDAQGIVRCPCYKCGKMLEADCGLHLPAELHRNPNKKSP